MSDNEMLYCLVAFILGWLLCRMMGNGFSVSRAEEQNYHCKREHNACIKKCKSKKRKHRHKCKQRCNRKKDNCKLNKKLDILDSSKFEIDPNWDDVCQYTNKNCPDACDVANRDKNLCYCLKPSWSPETGNGECAIWWCGSESIDDIPDWIKGEYPDNNGFKDGCLYDS